jgi:hypothetical protein
MPTTNSELTLGGNGQDGKIQLVSKVSATTVHIDGANGSITLDGPLATHVLQVQGKKGVGDGLLSVIREDGLAGVVITGHDITFPNGDIAEEFEFALADGKPEPGTVVVLLDEHRAQPSTLPYDRRVGGVVAGGGCYRPAIVLDRQQNKRGRVPISCLGKAFCKVDADHGAISVGDLLTTSPTLGHAMRASDRARAYGAILGKALRALETGKDLIPVQMCLH